MATHADQALVSPKSLQHFDTIIILGANGTLILAADASFTPECRAEAAEPATQADEAEVDSRMTLWLTPSRPEARKLNDGRVTMEVEVVGKHGRELSQRKS